MYMRKIVGFRSFLGLAFSMQLLCRARDVDSSFFERTKDRQTAADALLDGPPLSESSLCVNGTTLHWWGCGDKQKNRYVEKYGGQCVKDRELLQKFRNDSSDICSEGLCPDGLYCNVRGGCSSEACLCVPGEPGEEDEPAGRMLRRGTYDWCDSREHLKTRSPREITDEIFWFHVPKAGSSFLTTLFHWACPRVPGDVALAEGANRGYLHKHWKQWIWCDVQFTDIVPGHSPFVRSRDRGRAAGLFRRPQQRVMSAYESGLHHYGMRDFRRMQSVVREIATKDIQRALKTYAEWPGIAGCQTKMVLGKTCSSVYSLSAADLEEAKRIVENEFLFVGLTDEYDRSICLFHAMLGGVVRPNEFLNSRRSDRLRGGTESQRSLEPDAERLLRGQKKRWNSARFRDTPSSTKRTVHETRHTGIFRKLSNGSYDESVLRAIDYKDPFDEALYDYVKKIFEQRGAMYDIRACMGLAQRTRDLLSARN